MLKGRWYILADKYDDNQITVNVYGEGIRADIFRYAIRGDIRYGVNINLDNIVDEEFKASVKEEYVIVSDVSEKIFLTKQGFNPDKIIIFFDRRIKTKQAKDIITFNRRFLKSRYWISKCLSYQIERRKGQTEKSLINRIKEDVFFLKKYHKDKKIVFWGYNKYTIYYISLLNSERIWGIIPYEKENIGLEVDVDKGKIKSIEDLIYEDLDSLYFYFMDKNEKRKSEGQIVELGGYQRNLFYLGRKRNVYAGTKVLNLVDPIVGFARKDGNTPGFVVFGEENIGKENAYKIVTLGGSTSDPLLENLRSWSEFLYQMLIKTYDIPIIIYAGGVSSYTVAQETIKLIKDAIVLNPDLVISYSGVNDSCDDFNLPLHPFVRTYMPRIYEKAINASIRNEFSENALVTGLMLGVEDNCSNAYFWYKCEKIMSAVCGEFNIAFHGMLQAVYPRYWISNDMKGDGMKKRDDFFEEAKKLISDNSQPNIHDFTEIMKGNEDVFYDYCHVYEKGNRIIAKEILPFVMEEIGKGIVR